MIAASIFKAYDIRGIVDETLTDEAVELIGRAYGSEALAQSQKTVVIARDGRLSSPKISAALSKGLRSTGCDVIDIGMVPTPVLYFATHVLKTGTGIMITGSHNPPQYNGLKMVLAGHTLYSESIQQLLKRILNNELVRGDGSYKEQDVRQHYLDEICADVKLAKPLKIAVDSGNGVAGELAPALFKRMGCEVIELYSEIDGSFPNHHPDPSKLENLIDLGKAIEEFGVDLGLAFDGDGDRVGIIDNRNNIIWPDRQMMLYAEDVLSRNPGAQIIYDIKSSNHLDKEIKRLGGDALMWKTGHSFIKAKMKETGALLAGEMSGHIFFKERWYGFDDGLYSAARMLEILSKKEQPADVVFNALPDSFNTPEIQIQFAEGEHYRFMDKLKLVADFGSSEISTIDGMRVNYDDGWGLIRPSNTTPCLVLRFEADSEEALEKVQEKFRQQILNVDSTIQLEF
ncbi:MAG: phosphomannomutase/phosphoglucomutase [Gammaproteobacteria bacterium]|nr:phosphomannomutase/phosphoglucomutase [Gammaproteobacteria bacterium]